MKAFAELAGFPMLVVTNEAMPVQLIWACARTDGSGDAPQSRSYHTMISELLFNSSNVKYHLHAISVLRLLTATTWLERTRFYPSRVRAQCNAPYHPVASNSILIINIVSSNAYYAHPS